VERRGRGMGVWKILATEVYSKGEDLQCSYLAKDEDM
jgi:hypothetical protein